MPNLLKSFPEGLIALDFETTGLSPISDEIIELAAVKLNAEGKISTFSSLVQPQNSIPVETIAFHHITDDMVSSAPGLAEVLPGFMNFLGELPLMAHNITMDAGFLIKALHDQNLKFPTNNLYDSCTLTRKLYKKENLRPKNYKLSTLCDYFQLTLEQHHRALDDAQACFDLIQKLSESSKFQLHLKNSFKAKLSDYQKLSDWALPTRLQPLIEKSRRKEILEISYRGGSLEQDFRPVMAMGVLPMPHGLCLHALCLVDFQHKSFALRKIKNLREINEQDQVLWQQKVKENTRST